MPLWARRLHERIQQGSGAGLTINGLFAIGLALFALHALKQPLVYNIFAFVGGVLVIWGCLRIFTHRD